MITSKLKFFSPIHTNYNINIIQFILISFYTYLFITTGELTHHFLIAILIKMLDFVGIFNNIFKETDYSKWLEFKETDFYKNVMNTKYIFWVFSIIYLSLCFVEMFSTESILNKFLELTIIIIILTYNITYLYIIKKIN